MIMSIFIIIIGHRKRAVTPISIGATAPFWLKFKLKIVMRNY